MDELERAYLLSGEELLLLFSLLDSRPVVAFALPDPAQVPPAHWKQAGVGLCRKGLAAYTDAGLAPAEELAGLISACKGADTVCLAFCRDADCKTQALYWGDGQTVLLEGRIWPGYRLCAWAQDQDPGRWLDDCLGLPARVPARSPETVGDIEQLPPGPAWGESAVAWGRGSLRAWCWMSFAPATPSPGWSGCAGRRKTWCCAKALQARGCSPTASRSARL